MEDFSDEKWMQLYRSALVESNHSRLAERVAEAREEINAGLERPGLRTSESQAMRDALRGLRVLAREASEANENLAS